MTGEIVSLKQFPVGCRKVFEGIAVAPYSPLGSGLLTGKYLAGGAGRLSTDKRCAARYGQDWVFETVRVLSHMAAETGVDARIEALSPQPAPATDRLEEAMP